MCKLCSSPAAHPVCSARQLQLCEIFSVLEGNADPSCNKRQLGPQRVSTVDLDEPITIQRQTLESVYSPNNPRFIVSLFAAALTAGHSVLHVEVDRVVGEFLSPVLHLSRAERA